MKTISEDFSILLRKKKELEAGLGKIKIERKYISIPKKTLQLYLISTLAIVSFITALSPLVGVEIPLNQFMNVALSLLAVVFSVFAFISSGQLKIEKEKAKRLDLLELELKKLLEETEEMLTKMNKES